MTNCKVWMDYWLLLALVTVVLTEIILAVKYARENGLPFFGICLGMQMSVIEFARNQLGLPQAHSTEMDPATPDPVIDLMEGQKAINQQRGHHAIGRLSM